VDFCEECSFKADGFYYIGSAEGREYPDLQVGDEVNPRSLFRWKIWCQLANPFDPSISEFPLTGRAARSIPRPSGWGGRAQFDKYIRACKSLIVNVFLEQPGTMV
jgi:hypothetical protein